MIQDFEEGVELMNVSESRRMLLRVTSYCWMSDPHMLATVFQRRPQWSSAWDTKPRDESSNSMCRDSLTRTRTHWTRTAPQEQHAHRAGAGVSPGTSQRKEVLLHISRI